MHDKMSLRTLFIMPDITISSERRQMHKKQVLKIYFLYICKYPDLGNTGLVSRLYARLFEDSHPARRKDFFVFPS